MGTALAHALRLAGRKVRLWCRQRTIAREIAETRRNAGVFPDLVLADGLVATGDLPTAVAGALLLIVAVPSYQVGWLATQLRSMVTGRQIVLSATKGLDPNRCCTLSKILREETRAGAVGAIEGPHMMTDDDGNRMTAMLIAASDGGAAQISARLLTGAHMTAYVTDDLAGIELYGALRNVVEVTMGIFAGLRLGSDITGAALGSALREIREVAESLGADPATCRGLNGLGEIYSATAWSTGINYRVGFELGRGKPLAAIVDRMVAMPEGVGTTRACRQIAHRLAMQMPIAELTAAVLDGELQVDQLAAEITAVVRARGSQPHPRRAS